MVLLLGLVGGGYLSSSRHDQQVADAANARLMQQQKIAQVQAAAYLAAAPQRTALQSAQAAAKAAATKAATTAAVQAKKAQDTARKAAGTTASRSQTTPRTPATNIGPIPSSCKSYSGNRAIGCSLVLSAGLGLEQMVCLDHMWTKESNWRTTAENPSSHSYGIPQSLPASKMAAFGSDYRTNPATQIKWGLSYIKNRYHTPCGAWSFWQGHNFY